MFEQYILYVFVLRILSDMSLLNKNECEHRSPIVDDDDDDDELNSADEKEEEINILEQVQGLFSTDIYPNVIDMFRAYQPNFNLIEFLKTHQISSQYDYIRLINYIRSEVCLILLNHSIHLFVS